MIHLKLTDIAGTQIGFVIGVLLMWSLGYYDRHSAIITMVATHFSSFVTWAACRRAIAERQRARQEMLEKFD